MVGVDPNATESGVNSNKPTTAMTTPMNRAKKNPVAAIFSALSVSCAPNFREM